MTSPSKKVLQKIKRGHIQVIPKWHFLLKNYTIWILCLASILIGGFGFSVLLFLIQNSDWDIYGYIHKSFVEYLIIVLPYVWLAFVLFFTLVACYNARHTKFGYRYRTFWLVGIGIIGSLIFGLILNFAGLSLTIDKVFLSKIPFYDKIVHHHDKYWMNPGHGLLGGKIMNIGTNTTFILQDFRARNWTVLFNRAPAAKRERIEEGNMVKLIGTMEGDNIFSADEIRLWLNSRFETNE